MYGTQAFLLCILHKLRFENDVKMYGTQAFRTPRHLILSFENDVKMYGCELPIKLTLAKQKWRISDIFSKK